MADQAKSPDSLAKTQDGSTFAAKARAAELNATRARKAEAKYTNILTGNDDVDFPPLAPVSRGSLKVTRSRSRGSKAWKPQNNLSELPEASGENIHKSPSSQQYSSQILQRTPSPKHSPQHPNSSFDLAKAPPLPSSSGEKAPGILPNLSREAGYSEQPGLSLAPSIVPKAPTANTNETSLSKVNTPVAIRPTVPTFAFSSRPSIKSLQCIPPTQQNLQQTTPSDRLVEGSIISTSSAVKTPGPSDVPLISSWPFEPTVETSPRHPHRAYEPDFAPFTINPAHHWDPEMPPLGMGGFDMTPHSDRQSSQHGHQGSVFSIGTPNSGLSLHQNTPYVPYHQSSFRSSNYENPTSGVTALMAAQFDLGPTPSANEYRTRMTSGASPLADRTNRNTTMRPPATDDVFGGGPQVHPDNIQYRPRDDYSVQDVRYGTANNLHHFNSSSPYAEIASFGQRASVGQGVSPSVSELTHGGQTKMNPKNPQDAIRILSKHRNKTYTEVIALPDEDKIFINIAERTLNQPVTNLSLSAHGNTQGNASEISERNTNSRDPNPYTNPNNMELTSQERPSAMFPPRTVAYDPLAKQPSFIFSSDSRKSSLKPEATVYTPRVTTDGKHDAIIKVSNRPYTSQSLQEVRPSAQAALATKSTDNHLSMQAAGNVAMANIIHASGRQTLEDSIDSFRTNPMDRDFDAVKKQLQDCTNAMVSSLSGDSFPDVDLAGFSVTTPKPKPIGYGRPSTGNSPAAALTSNRDSEPLDNKAGIDLLANVIANLKQHKDSLPGDPFNHYGPPPSWAIDQTAQGNKSFFDPDWKTPPPRVARDPRRLNQTMTADGRQTYHEDPVRGRRPGSTSGNASGIISGSLGRRQ